MVMVEDTFKICDEDFASIHRSATGRNIKLYEKTDKELYRSISEWFCCSTESEFSKHYLASSFMTAARDSPIFNCDTPWFRGRKIDCIKARLISEFGPPPKDQQSAGRYNNSDQAVLYLSNNCNGVGLEILDFSAGENTFYCQAFSIPFKNLKVVDFSSNNNNPLIAMTLDRCERTSKDTYAKSQIIASLVKHSGYDGFVTQGVHGTTENNYLNLVIFNHEHWSNWSIGNSFKCNITILETNQSC